MNRDWKERTPPPPPCSTRGVGDCILTSTSFVLTPRNIISPIAHCHQVAISWSRHVQRRTKRFDFADSDQSNFVRGSPSPVSHPPTRLFLACALHRPQYVAKVSQLFLIHIYIFIYCSNAENDGEVSGTIHGDDGVIYSSEFRCYHVWSKQ